MSIFLSQSVRPVVCLLVDNKVWEVFALGNKHYCALEKYVKYCTLNLISNFDENISGDKLGHSDSLNKMSNKYNYSVESKSWNM